MGIGDLKYYIAELPSLGAGLGAIFMSFFHGVRDGFLGTLDIPSYIHDVAPFAIAYLALDYPAIKYQLKDQKKKRIEEKVEKEMKKLRESSYYNFGGFNEAEEEKRLRKKYEEKYEELEKEKLHEVLKEHIEKLAGTMIMLYGIGYLIGYFKPV